MSEPRDPADPTRVVPGRGAASPQPRGVADPRFPARAQERRNTAWPDEERVASLRRRLVSAVARACPQALVSHADDLVQTALLRVLDARPGEGEGNERVPSSYLERAAYSAIVDEWRRRRRRAEVAEEDATFDTLEHEGAGPDRRAASRELGRAIRECLAGLVAPRRLAVTLHLQGDSVPGLARRLGWTGKRGENLVYRGLADLRRCLAGKGWKQ